MNSGKETDLFALPIPAGRVTCLRMNSAVVSNNFTTTITTAHRLSSPAPCVPKQLDGLDLPNIHWPLTADRLSAN
jgi:hypothetical protein